MRIPFWGKVSRRAIWYTALGIAAVIAVVLLILNAIEPKVIPANTGYRLGEFTAEPYHEQSVWQSNGVLTVWDAHSRRFEHPSEAAHGAYDLCRSRIPGQPGPEPIITGYYEPGPPGSSCADNHPIWFHQEPSRSNRDFIWLDIGTTGADRGVGYWQRWDQSQDRHFAYTGDPALGDDPNWPGWLEIYEHDPDHSPFFEIGAPRMRELLAAQAGMPVSERTYPFCEEGTNDCLDLRPYTWLCRLQLANGEFGPTHNPRHNLWWVNLSNIGDHRAAICREAFDPDFAAQYCWSN